MKHTQTLFKSFVTAMADRSSFDPQASATKLICRCNAENNLSKNELISLLQQTFVLAQSAIGLTGAQRIDIAQARERFKEVQSILQSMKGDLDPSQLTAAQRKTVADAHAATVGFLYKTSAMKNFDTIQYHLDQALLFDPKHEIALNYKYEFSTDYSPPRSNKPQ